MSKRLGRRHFIGGAVGVAAWPALPGSVWAARPMGFDEARHLLSRTSFGPTPAAIRTFETVEYEVAVGRFLGGATSRTKTAPPSWTDDTPKEASRAKAEFVAEKRKAKADGMKMPGYQPGQDQRRDLQFWWIEEMLVSEQPLVERMVLFWHNHFTSSLKKVRYMPALYRQNELFRREALGNFATLLKEIARDPAMLLYLDGARSVAREPNENFARELLELFTLGEGQYGEADIKAAARAFTGWSVDGETGRFIVRPDQHDDGQKNFLGKTGRFGGNEILDILLAHPRTAQTIVEKLWREFVSLTPDKAEVSRLASLFRDGGYEIKPLLRALLLSPFFRDRANRAALIKSPLELVVGTVQLLGLPTADKLGMLRMLQGLGQIPFDPPNVKGWPGGERWITTYTLMLRQQFLRRMIEATNVTSTATGGTMMEGKKRRTGDDRTMQLTEPPTGEPAAIRLPPALAGLDSPTLVRMFLPRPPIDPLDPGSPPGVVAAGALLDVSYQLK